MLKSKKALCLGIVLLATGCKTVPVMNYQQRIPELGQIQPNECPPKEYQGEIHVSPNTFLKTNFSIITSSTIRERTTGGSGRSKSQFLGTMDSRKTPDGLLQTLEFTEIWPKTDDVILPFSVSMKVGDYFSIEDIEFEGVPYEDRKQIEAVFNKEALSLLKFEKTNLRLGDSVLPSSMRIPMFGQNVDLDVRSRVLGISAYNARPVLVFDYAMLGQLSVGKRGASVSSAGYYCFDLTAGSSAYTYEEQSILSSTNEANLEIKRTQYFKALFPSDSASPISDFLNIKDGLNSPTASDSDPNLLRSKLANLKKLFDDGLISRDEYDVKRRALLEAY